MHVMAYDAGDHVISTTNAAGRMTGKTDPGSLVQSYGFDA